MTVNLQIQHAVVTGATGLIGRWLLIELTRHGVEVCALLRRPAAQLPALRDWIAARGGDPARLRAAPFDLAAPDLGLDADGDAALERAEAVFHLAALFGFGIDRAAAHRANVAAPLQLIERLAGRPHLRRFVHVSGYRTEGAPARALDVDDAAALDHHYAAHGAYEASKMEAHVRVARAADTHGVPLTRVSPAMVIGDSRTGETTQFTGLADTLHQLARGRLPALPGGADTWLPAVTVDFLAALMARLPGDAASAGAHVVVFDDATPTLPALVRRAADLLGVRAPRWRVPVGLLRRLPARLTGAHPESLSFISADRYDPRPLRNLTARLDLALPPIDVALRRWVDFLRAADFGGATAATGRTVEAAGARAFVRGPRGAPTVYLHGLLLDGDCWDATRAATGEDVASLRPDLPGLGLSGDGGGAPGDWLRALAAPATAPQRIVAHSLGTAFAVEYAAAHPERVAGLVLVSPFFLQRPAPPFMRWAPLTARVLRWLSGRAAAPQLTGADPATRARLLGHLRRPGVARATARWLAWASRAAVRARLTAQLASLSVPVTLVHGERDPLVRPPPAHVDTVTVPAAGHQLPLTHPVQLAEVLRRASGPSR